MSSALSSSLSGSFFNPLSKWKTKGKLDLTVGCDVGGSGFRIRLSNALNSSQYIDVPHFKAQNTVECLAALKHIEHAASQVIPDFQVKASAMAVAGPIDNKTVVMTNWKGSPEVRTLSLTSLPSKLFPRDKSVFLNDLQAGAYGIIAAQIKDTLKDHFEALWPTSCPQGPIVSKTRTAVLAAGSGLGIGIIEKTPMMNLPYVIATELGHLQIPMIRGKSPKYESEFNLIQFISDEMYEGKQAPEFEDIASGRGLSLVYQYYVLKETGTKIAQAQINSSEVASKAEKGDKIALQSMLTHYQFLLRAAKSVATSLSCDSVLLALDNQVKNDWFVQKTKDELHSEFYNFIRPDWMKNIRVYTQTKNQNFNLLGTGLLADSLLK